jgi:hypothetical protein
MPVHSSGAWERQLETIPLAQLRLIYRRSVPTAAFSETVLKNKQSIIDACLRLPTDSPGRTALNEAIVTRARQVADNRRIREEAAKAKRREATRARRLVRSEVCAAMYHDSLGDIQMFMETPTPAEVSLRRRIIESKPYVFYQGTRLYAVIS